MPYQSGNLGGMDVRVWLLVVMITLLPMAMANAQEVYVGNYTVEENETFKVTVFATATNVVGIDVEIDYDPNVIIAQKVDVNQSYSCGSGCFKFENIANDQGFVKIALINTNGISVNNTPILDVTFKAVGNPGDSTELKLKSTMSDPNFNMIHPSVENGFVSIGGAVPTQTTPVETTETATVTATTVTPTPTETETATTQTQTATPTQTTPTQTTTATPTQAVVTTTVVSTAVPTTTTETIHQTVHPMYTKTVIETETTATETTTTVTTTTETKKSTGVPGFDSVLCLLAITSV